MSWDAFLRTDLKVPADEAQARTVLDQVRAAIVDGERSAVQELLFRKRYLFTIGRSSKGGQKLLKAELATLAEVESKLLPISEFLQVRARRAFLMCAIGQFPQGIAEYELVARAAATNSMNHFALRCATHAALGHCQLGNDEEAWELAQAIESMATSSSAPMHSRYGSMVANARIGELLKKVEPTQAAQMYSAARQFSIDHRLFLGITAEIVLIHWLCKQKQWAEAEARCIGNRVLANSTHASAMFTLMHCWIWCEGLRNGWLSPCRPRGDGRETKQELRAAVATATEELERSGRINLMPLGLRWASRCSVDLETLTLPFARAGEIAQAYGIKRCLVSEIVDPKII